MEGANYQRFTSSVGFTHTEEGADAGEASLSDAFLADLLGSGLERADPEETIPLDARQIEVLSSAGSSGSLGIEGLEFPYNPEDSLYFDFESLYGVGFEGSAVTGDPSRSNGPLDTFVMAILDLGEDDDVIRIGPDNIEALLEERGRDIGGVADDISTTIRKAKGTQFQEIICPGIIKIVEIYGKDRGLKRALFVLLSPVLKTLTPLQTEQLLAAFREKQAVYKRDEISDEVLKVHPDRICDVIEYNEVELPDILREAIDHSKGNEFQEIICPALVKAVHYYADHEASLAEPLVAFIATLTPEQRALCSAAYERGQMEVNQASFVDSRALLSSLDLYITALSSSIEIHGEARRSISFDPSIRALPDLVAAPTMNRYILDLRDGQGSKKSPRVRQVVGGYIATGNDLELNYRIELAIAAATPHEYTHILCRGLVKAVHIYYLKRGREAFQLLGKIRSLLASQPERLAQLVQEFQTVGERDRGIRDERSAFLTKCIKILSKRFATDELVLV